MSLAAGTDLDGRTLAAAAAFVVVAAAAFVVVVLAYYPGFVESLEVLAVAVAAVAAAITWPRIVDSCHRYYY